MTFRPLCAGALLASMMSSWGHAQMSISPLSLTLSPTQQATSMAVHNRGSTPLSLQVRALAWQQSAFNGIQLSATTDIAVSPAMVTVAAGAKQVIRVVVVHAKEVEHERYYRVLIDQLPAIEQASGSTINVLTRYSLPVFVTPRHAGVHQLKAYFSHCDHGEDLLILQNHGQRRARITGWRITRAEHTLYETDGLAGYVLSQGRLALALPVERLLPGKLVLSVKTDVGSWRSELFWPVSSDEHEHKRIGRELCAMRSSTQ